MDADSFRVFRVFRGYIPTVLIPAQRERWERRFLLRARDHRFLSDEHWDAERWSEPGSAVGFGLGVSGSLMSGLRSLSFIVQLFCTMGCQITEFRGKGFYCWRSLLEVWLRVLSLHLDGHGGTVSPGWKHDLRDKWLLGFLSCVAEGRKGLGSTVTVSSSDAEALATLWRSQIFGRDYQSLCHEPVYGFRFYHGSTLKFETSVCFHCSNFYVTGRGGSGWWGFDSKSAQAEQLLKRLEEIFPASVPKPKIK